MMLKKKLRHKILWGSTAAIIIVNVLFTNHFYYKLLQFQLGSQAGRFIKAKNIAPAGIIAFRVDDPLNSLPFYAGHSIAINSELDAVKGKEYVLTTNEGLGLLKDQGYTVTIIKQMERFKVTELTPEFLNPATRSKALVPYYLAKLR